MWRGCGALGRQHSAQPQREKTHPPLKKKLSPTTHHPQAPRASENFLALCASNYYDGVIFHRNIKGFSECRCD